MIGAKRLPVNIIPIGSFVLENCRSSIREPQYLLRFFLTALGTLIQSDPMIRFPGMRLLRCLTSLALLLLLAAGVTPVAVDAANTSQAIFHTVAHDDTWSRIAALYRVPVLEILRSNGVTNPTLLEQGQRIFIPTGGVSHESPSQTYTDQGVWYVAVASGDPVHMLLLLNGWESPVEAAAQPITAVHRRADVVAMVSPTPSSTSPVATSVPPTLNVPSAGALHRSRLGIQGHFSIPDQERDVLLDMVAYELQFAWVKVQVDWSRIEYAPGQYSIELDKLDAFMQDGVTRELHILLSVVKAPDWARSTTDEDGPPTDRQSYYNFLRFIVQRYGYQISAIEVWNEPNLRREWNGATLSGSDYVDLLAGAYQAIKSADPRITVISAGLAPTGVASEVAMDDRQYLRQMYEAGLASHTDVVGIHPYGWANPPSARCCGDSGGVPSHNNHPSFFFLNTIEDYRAIQEEFGDSSRQLWATEFGWGTMEGLDLPMPEEQPFFAYLSADKQAQYIRDAYLMAQEWDFMGPMFLWNLNVATLDGHLDANQAGYSILLDIYHPRAAFNVLRDTPKSDQ